MSSPRFHVQPTSFFLIYIDDLVGDLSNAKLFADETSVFSVVHNENTSGGEVHNELNKWVYQWKISFNSDPIKQAQEIIFTRKISKEDQLH